jgi:DnaJ family protein C protein 17
MAVTCAEGAALSVEQIEKAYRTQSRLRHPDKRPDDPNATADFQSCAGSYKLLRDESLCRQFYKVADRRSLVSGGP